MVQNHTMLVNTNHVKVVKNIMLNKISVPSEVYEIGFIIVWELLLPYTNWMSQFN